MMHARPRKRKLLDIVNVSLSQFDGEKVLKAKLLDGVPQLVIHLYV